MISSVLPIAFMYLLANFDVVSDSTVIYKFFLIIPGNIVISAIYFKCLIPEKGVRKAGADGYLSLGLNIIEILFRMNSININVPTDF